MEKKQSAYAITKAFEIQRLETVRFLEFSGEDVEIGHTSDFWEFLYVDTGEIMLGLNGADSLLKQGDICLCKPETRYSLQGSAEKPARVFSVAFACDSAYMRVFYGKQGMLPAELVHYMPLLMQDAYQSFELPVQGMPQKAVVGRAEAPLGGEQSFVNRLELFLIELARKEISPHVVPLLSKALLKDELVERIITILEENVYHKLTMKRIVEDMNYSETYIARRFKAVCGQSIMSYYLQLRIRESQRLIRETEKNFTEIAGVLGFSDSQHFTKTFKRYVNLSPKEYLKSVRPYSMKRNKNLVGEEAPKAADRKENDEKTQEFSPKT